jgi:hypothetical protein
MRIEFRRTIINLLFYAVYAHLQPVSTFRPSPGIVHVRSTYVLLPYIGQYLHMRVFCVAVIYILL